KFPSGVSTNIARPFEVAACPLGVVPSRYTCTIAAAAIGEPEASCTITASCAPLLNEASALLPLSCCQARASAAGARTCAANADAAATHTPPQISNGEANCMARDL